MSTLTSIDSLIRSCSELQGILQKIAPADTLNQFNTENCSMEEWEDVTAEFYRRYTSSNPWRSLSQAECLQAWSNYKQELENTLIFVTANTPPIIH
jgi:hypothetical protein